MNDTVNNAASLILVRHGESEWNAKGIWTGLQDIPLSQKGFEEAKGAGEKIRNIPFDIVFTSPLIRAKQTYEVIKNQLNLNLPVVENPALDERDYGVLTGKNKWDLKKELGEKRFFEIRRGWDVLIPEGESLKDVYNRVIPYYQTTILPQLKSGKNVLIIAHGNSLRALIKYLEKISDTDIANLELKTGEVYVYRLDSTGKTLSKQIIGR